MDMEANSWFHLGLLRIDCKDVDSSIHIKVRWEVLQLVKKSTKWKYISSIDCDVCFHGFFLMSILYVLLILDESRWISLSHSNGCNKCQLQKQKAIV